jgi:aryl-alcohol dehydrogenase-like predicted oxidoreductase
MKKRKLRNTNLKVSAIAQGLGRSLGRERLAGVFAA